MTFTIRPVRESDAEPCARIVHAAFHRIASDHGFPPDFESVDVARGMIGQIMASDDFYGVVATRDDAVIGSNFLMEGDEIKGVGPITIDPTAQGAGVGRGLMQAVMARAEGAAGIRLLQDGFNMRSLSLYTSLGFAAREPMVMMRGVANTSTLPAGASVRPMLEEDIDACDALCQQAHGISRRQELITAVRHLEPLVLERGGKVAAYLTMPRSWALNHAVAGSDADMQALLIGAGQLQPPLAFLLPTRADALFRWCLGAGFRAVKPMTLMSIGRYQTPTLPYMPSVFY